MYLQFVAICVLTVYTMLPVYCGWRYISNESNAEKELKPAIK